MALAFRLVRFGWLRFGGIGLGLALCARIGLNGANYKVCEFAGDTVAALNHAGAGESFTFVSTAGGAFLEWMEGRDLPGVSVLKQ